MKSPPRTVGLLVLVLATSGAKCLGPDDDGGTTPSGKRATGSACAGANAGLECEGGTCLALNANDQGQAAICSQACAAQTCGLSNICLDIGGGVGACFRQCTSQADCRDGFVCIALQDGSARGVCLVTSSTGGLPVADGGLVISDGGMTTVDGGGSLSATDGDGTVYGSVVIGSQRWLTRNLSTTKLNDGTPIPDVADSDAWRNAVAPARCDYENNAANVPTYGRLYSWYAVATRKLCPVGWHVPSDAEWTALEAFLGEPSLAGGRLKEAGTSHWMGPNTAATNDTGFTALPAGTRFSTASFFNLTYDGYFWTSTQGSDPAYARYRWTDFNSGFILANEDYKNDGLSVRCLED
jgi:uncharacterized protein (TIGR02145 family)